MLSQGSATSRTSAVGELADGDVVQYIFSQRRKTGGKYEYLCKIRGAEPDGRVDPEGRDEWLKPSDISASSLAQWEVMVSRRLEETKHKDTSNKRRALRDEVASMRVIHFKESDVGKLMRSQIVKTREGAAPNRHTDSVGALVVMQEILLYEINSSSQAQCTADATKAGEQIAERAHDFDFIGQTAVSINDLRKNGRIKGPSREPFIEDRAFEVLTFLCSRAALYSVAHRQQ